MKGNADAIYNGLSDGSVVSIHQGSIVLKKEQVTKIVDEAGNLTIIYEESQPIQIPLHTARLRKTRYSGETYQFPDGTLVELDSDSAVNSVSFQFENSSPTMAFQHSNWQTFAEVN